MKKNQSPALLTSLACCCLALWGGRLQAQKIIPSYFLQAGPGFCFQMADGPTEQASIKGGPGYLLGGGIQYGGTRLAVSYLNSWHTLEIMTEEVRMKFSDLILSVSLDFSNTGYPKPYLLGLLAFNSLTDKNGDGYKQGTTLGAGLGLRLPVRPKVTFNVNGVYGLNRYSKFEVADASWADTTKVSGNHLMLTALFEYNTR